jgi:hypothetical protein
MEANMNQYKKNSSAPEDFELLSRKETYTIWQKLIKDYFSSVHDKNGFVFNLKDMKDSIEKHNDVPTISDATFYRYTKKMHIQEYEHPYNGKHYYEINESADDMEETLLEFDLAFRKYNKTLHLHVNPHLGELLTAFLNRNFDKNLFHSTCSQGFITCYYYFGKEYDKSELGKTYLTAGFIKKKIKKLAKSIAYNNSDNFRN